LNEWLEKTWTEIFNYTKMVTAFILISILGAVLGSFNCVATGRKFLIFELIALVYWTVLVVFNEPEPKYWALVLVYTVIFGTWTLMKNKASVGELVYLFLLIIHTILSCFIIQYATH